jgi:uncharacterized protein
MEFGFEFLVILSVILFSSALVQGSIGFGFPLISTPLLAMITDMKTAILYVVIPTLLINVVSLFSEGDILKAFKRFYPLALMAMVGSAIGTQILIYSSSEFFKLLLAISIFFYLFIQKFKFEMKWVNEKPTFSIIVFGLLAGIIGGLTNVMSLILIIYSLEAKHSRKEVIQSANLCFLFGKLIQIIIFSIHGSFTQEVLNTSILSLLVVGIAVVIGIKVKNKIPQDNYNKIIKVFLFLMAVALVYQTLF